MAARVAITGFGAVTPVGNDAETTWQPLAGRSGVRKIEPSDAETFPVNIAGLVEDFDLSSKLPNWRRRLTGRRPGSTRLDGLPGAGQHHPRPRR